MSEQPKELGQRTKAELEELFGNMCAGWEHGVVVTQERFGNGDTRFTERSMTQMELAARYVAAEIGANIFEIAGRAAFAPIITFSQIQVHLGPVFDDLTAEIADLRAKLSQAEKDLALSKPLYSRRKLEEENAQLRRQVERGQWRDISTAPKDGTDILLWAESWDMTWGIQAGHYGEDCWHTAEGKASDNEDGFDPDVEPDEDEEGWEDRNLGPTHWMPMPATPRRACSSTSTECRPND